MDAEDLEIAKYPAAKEKHASSTSSCLLNFINPPLASQSAAQRLALAAWGGSVDSPPKRENLPATKNA